MLEVQTSVFSGKDMGYIWFWKFKKHLCDYMSCKNFEGLQIINLVILLHFKGYLTSFENFSKLSNLFGIQGYCLQLRIQTSAFILFSAFILPWH